MNTTIKLLMTLCFAIICFYTQKKLKNNKYTKFTIYIFQVFTVIYLVSFIISIMFNYKAL